MTVAQSGCLKLSAYAAGACQHALGYHGLAVKDYERAFCIDAGEKDKVPDEARQQQFLAFYQKELALYIRAHLDDPVESFCLDKDLHPIFKVVHCILQHVHCMACALS